MDPDVIDTVNEVPPTILESHMESVMLGPQIVDGTRPVGQVLMTGTAEPIDGTLTTYPLTSENTFFTPEYYMGIDPVNTDGESRGEAVTLTTHRGSDGTVMQIANNPLLYRERQEPLTPPEVFSRELTQNRIDELRAQEATALAASGQLTIEQLARMAAEL